MRRLASFFLALYLASCSGPYMGKDLFGADEFVLDSYKIREGKLSILEMEGYSVAELGDEDLEEYQDRIHEDDVLRIFLYHPKRHDIVQAVSEIGNSIGYQVVGGEISLPDISSVKVEGLTLGRSE